MSRYRIVIEYDGTGMAGWQQQKNPNTIQQRIQEAVYKFSGQEVIVHGSGRTDAGVHAIAQVAHFDLMREYTNKTIVNAINFYLKGYNIGIKAAQIVDESFHARFSAKCRHYQYLIINQFAPVILARNRAWHVKTSLNLEAMQEGAALLKGHHDFTSFRAKSCQGKSPLKTINNITITKLDEVTIALDISAPSFLHHMVRNITGTLVMVGSDKFKAEQISQMLLAKDRASAGVTAPAGGLYFVRVDY
jgi:tRNA pseudouridine38-40 synthase